MTPRHDQLDVQCHLAQRETRREFRHAQRKVAAFQHTQAPKEFR